MQHFNNNNAKKRSEKKHVWLCVYALRQSRVDKHFPFSLLMANNDTEAVANKELAVSSIILF